MGKNRKKTNLGHKGFLDLEFRNELDEPEFKVKRRSLFKAIEDFEDFLWRKYGIKGFSAREKKKQKN